MYLQHFGLTEFPFGLTPDTQFYFDLPSQSEALNVLLIALQNGEGFIKITGDVGTGKTMLNKTAIAVAFEPLRIVFSLFLMTSLPLNYSS